MFLAIRTRHALDVLECPISRVGLDYAITESVFARVEYRYTNLATAGFVSADTNSAETANRAPINDLRAGIAYKI